MLQKKTKAAQGNIAQDLKDAFATLSKLKAGSTLAELGVTTQGSRATDHNSKEKLPSNSRRNPNR